MAFDWGAMLGTFAAGGGSGGVLGYISVARRGRMTRQESFDKRVDERLDELEKEVAECRKRDGEVVILRMGLRMVVPEMLKLDRGNPVLQQVATALSALPKDGDNMHDLLGKLYDIPYQSEEREVRDDRAVG